MANLSLTACSFLLKKKHSRGKYIFFNDKLVRENEDEMEEYSLKEAFEDFCREHSNPIYDTNNKRTFHCEYEDSYCGETDNYKFIYCVIKSGVYGSASDIIDNTSREIVHRKTANQVEEKPFYLYIVIPKDSADGRVKIQKGMLFFQNVGPFGVKTVTTNYLKEHFSRNFNITFECRTIAVKLFVERMITPENIKQFIMTRNNKSSDASDNFSNGYGEETKIIGGLKFTENIWKDLMNKIKWVSKNKFNLFELEGVKYDSLKLKVKINDHERTVNMHNLDNLSIIETIPDEIQLADGHPHKEKLMKHFEIVAKDYLSEMVLQVERS